jgi:Stage II sporulation protein E (SpoIIE)
MSILCSSTVVQLYDSVTKATEAEGSNLAETNEGAAGSVLPRGRHNGAYDRVTPDQSSWISRVLTASRRAAEDMKLAKEVQARLFPRKLRRLETLSYGGVCLPAGQVGGDYFDFLDLGRGFLGLAIADVAGKGVAAALLITSLQASLRSQCAPAVDDIASLLRSVNRIFCENTPDASYGRFSSPNTATKTTRCAMRIAAILHPFSSIAARASRDSTGRPRCWGSRKIGAAQ